MEVSQLQILVINNLRLASINSQMNISSLAFQPSSGYT